MNKNSKKVEAKKSSRAAQSPLNGKISANQKLEQLAPMRSDSTDQALTSNQGVRIADNQNSLKAGTRGPSLLEDHFLREKLTSFDHERIPERVVHARGAAAHGVFESYGPVLNFVALSFCRREQ